MDDQIPLIPISQFRKNESQIIRQPTLNTSYWKQGTVGNWELINAFFGFDADLTRDRWPPPAELRNRFVANYLQTRPSVDQACPRMFRVTICIALRRFILLNRDPLRALNTKFDRQRLAGLRMAKNANVKIHQAFGLLYFFCQSLQQPMSDEIEWFKEKNITPAECQDMIQIWESLRMLLEAFWTRRLRRTILLERKLLREGTLQSHLQTADQLQRKLRCQKKRKFRADYSFELEDTDVDRMKGWVEDTMSHGMHRIYEVLSEEEMVSDEKIISEILSEDKCLTMSNEQGWTKPRPERRLFVSACEDYMNQELCDPDIISILS